MPVSGKEEPGVLSWKSSTDVSAGVPLKKRRFLLEPPSSPPRQESPPEVNDVKKNEESSSDSKSREKSGSDALGKEESYSELKEKEESGADVKNKEESGSNLVSKGESGLNLQNNVESTPDLKNNKKSSSDQGLLSTIVVDKSPETLIVSKMNLVEVKKETVSAPNSNLGHLDMDVSGLKVPEFGPVVNMGSGLREKSGSDDVEKEESRSELKEKQVSSADVNNKEESCTKLVRKEDSSLDLQNNIESTPNLKNNKRSGPDQGPSSTNVTNKSPGTSVLSKINLVEVKKESVSAPNSYAGHSDMDVSGLKLPELDPMVIMGSASTVESETKLVLTGKSSETEVLGTTIDTVSASVKKEIHNKQVEKDCELKLSTGLENDKLALQPKQSLILSLGHQNAESNSQTHESVDPSLFSLSLSKGKHSREEKSGDASVSNDNKFELANRSKWDLNTTMDAWEGSSGDDAGNESGKTTCVNNGRHTTSTPMVRASREKGKQVVATNEPRSSFPNSSIQHKQQPEDSLRLTLSSSLREMDFIRELSGLSAEVASGTNASTNLHSGLVSILNKNLSCARVVKSEPIDENSRNNSAGVKNSCTDLLNFNAVKREPVEKLNLETIQLSASNPQELTGQRSIISEPTVTVSQELCRVLDSRLQQSVMKFVHCQESGSSSPVLPMPLTPQKPSPSRLFTSSDISTSAELSNQFEDSIHPKEAHMGSDALVQAAAGIISKPVHHRVREVNMADLHHVDPEMKTAKELWHDLHVNGEASVSDEEKINISAEIVEDESYDSECESDGNQAFGSHLDVQDKGVKDDDDYEDGEVRDPLAHSKIKDPSVDGLDADSAKHVDCDNKQSSSGFPGETDINQSYADDKENESKIHVNATVDCIIGTVTEENCQQLTAKDDPLDNLLSDGRAATGADEKELSSSSQRELLDQTAMKPSQESTERDISCDGTTNSGNTTVTMAGEAKGETVEANNMNEKHASAVPVVEASLNSNNAAKDPSSGGNRSRIINLPRASVTSPSKMRSIPDRLPSSRNIRERYSDLDGKKFLPRGNRDEIESDGPRRFVGDRIQDQPFRNSRSTYTRGRGRFSGRFDNSRSEWGSGREFTLGSYNADYRLRNKHAAISDAELECNDYVTPPDGAALSFNRGRKSLNDDLHSFRHPSSRRLSPGGGDGPGGREIQMLRRIPRNISPSRRNDENGVALVGLRRDEKFVKALHDDIIDPSYTRPHSMYDRGDGQLVRGNRNFPAFQRRGFPRVRSKSPVGSRTRSPGPWSSPRRRSPDGFSGLQQLAQDRSPAMYGVERMRFPDRSCFAEEIVTRRRGGSPSYLARPSNDSVNVDSGRDHGHPRPINSRRSPSDRVFSRSTRRLDVLDPRIRTGDDEYFERPGSSGRFHEFHGEGSNGERKKCGERRGLTRSFRPGYIGDNDNIRSHLDDSPRPLRFCPERDTEFVGRDIREREFDERMKNRPMVAPRRIHTSDDSERNYRHSGQVWHDDVFNEGSGFKRRRF